MYPVFKIAPDAAEATEPLGTKDKFWYEGRLFLFKQVRPGTGEDWSEKIAAELARLLGLPHAEYDLAEWNTANGEVRGVRSRNFCPTAAALVLGNELLADADPEYAAGTVSKYRVPAHTVQRVMLSLRERAPELPLEWKPPSFVNTAWDTFIGYLLLDALIGNTDRHHENWGLIRFSGGTLHLAPTFDHASSLGRNLLEAERTERLRTKDQNHTIQAFAARAASGLYRAETDKKPLSPVCAFLEAAQFSRSAGVGWLAALRAIGNEQTGIITSSIPPERISDTAAEFARRLIAINQKSLLALGEELQ